ncbi:MAG: bifunctional UDP-N-acetylglucosamine diphosphorylase/glucosamine-1-phosphate N-acetyltransferase GlmU [Alphaproteobacteria bacterium]|nr:bifunctional UDP-N-acetylglucosamine diphosphorylase/glucosamine-1-phosphate N-acetyltransferase GlmU [Alphaproteobacteria bacterium]
MTNKTSTPLAVVVLAAGKGTRMRSALPKVLHPLAGLPLVGHVLAMAEALVPERRLVVVSEAQVGAAVSPWPSVVQELQEGTGHAVMQAGDALSGFTGDVLVLYGDTPLLEVETLTALLDARRSATAAAAVLGFRPADPGLYGRLVCDDNGKLERIVEARDADAAILALDLCNSGVMALDGGPLPGLLARLDNNNAKGEYYLTDIVAISAADGRQSVVLEAAEESLLGVDSRADLAVAEAVIQTRLRARAMASGATLTDPASTFLSHDTVLEQDVTVGPNVVFGPGVHIGAGSEILAFCHLEGVMVAAGARIGPFARLRPGTRLGEGARIGNFVETKAAEIAAGAKVNHLSYVGDASVGAGANIGAGTITCNYDGFSKHRTEIGAGAFIGSNTALVAPVSIGDGAMVGAGSTVTKDVEADVLAVARGEQRDIPDGAARFRRQRKD